MELKLNVKGDAAIKAKLDELAKRYPGATAAALYQEGMSIWNDSAKRAPVRFAVLRNSAYVAPPTMNAGDVTVEVGFGTQYAVYQHEGTSFRHPRGGEAKYLEKAVADVMSGYLERVAARIQANAQNGTGSVALAAPTSPGGQASSRGVSRLRRRHS